jgi:BirA family biotin operon repressor/biotin-[acetyl-CoA-carboxylase] ligase
MARLHDQAINAYRLAELRAAIRPCRLHYFASLGSTNTHASRMRRDGRLVAPSVVVTSRQTAGRGRGLNTWHAPRGVMTATIVLPAHDTLPPQHVPLVAGLALAEAVEALGASGVGVKWPNDLWHDDLKLAGLLCERLDGIDLVGVGLNVNAMPADFPASLRHQSTSIRALIGRPVPVTTVLTAVALRVCERLRDPRVTFASIRKDYERRHVLTGRLITVRDGPIVRSGACEGTDSSGRLLLRSDGSLDRIIAGSVGLGSG